VMQGLGVPVSLPRLVLFSIPVVLLSLLISAWQMRRL